VSAGSLLGRVDSRVGELARRAWTAHHRRRLTRIGWGPALDAGPGGWAAGGPPPRPGNAVEVLVDGAAALPRMAADLAAARAHVRIAGWYFSPGFALTRDDDPVVLRNLLAGLAERIDVRVIAWAGAPAPVFRPGRGDVRAVRDALCAGTRVRVALDGHERPLHCHHEKLIVIDGVTAYVGGIDLTSASGDRFDSSEHPARGAVGWHDAAVRIAGPAVQDVAEHLRARWHAVTGEDLGAPAPVPPAGATELQVVRTVPEGIYPALPHGDFTILESYLRALRAARRLVYLESQFLWSPEIEAVLRDKLRRPPTPGFRVLTLLPARPNDGGDDTRGVLGALLEADAGAGRVLACTLFARRGRVSDPVYVHAKVGIVDDEWLTIGSANLNEHSMFNDTEMNVVTRDPALARATRLRLWAEHLERSPEEVGGDPTRAIDELWRPTAEEQLARHADGRPLTHRLMRLPHVSRHSEQLYGPLQGLVVDG
jgi:phosphatidylserine/phosphatidylglycerophosphate/cardiolipin synthase-like enzyme